MASDGSHDEFSVYVFCVYLLFLDSDAVIVSICHDEFSLRQILSLLFYTFCMAQFFSTLN